MIKPKPCKQEGCEYPRWSKGFCQYHKPKKEVKPIKRSYPIKNNRKPIGKKKKVTGELAFFLALWEVRPHVSFISGEHLEEFSVMYMSHVLPKGTYKKYRLFSRNLVFMTAEEHYQYHNNLHLCKEDKKWDKFFELFDELKREYYKEFYNREF